MIISYFKGACTSLSDDTKSIYDQSNLNLLKGSKSIAFVKSFPRVQDRSLKIKMLSINPVIPIQL